MHVRVDQPEELTKSHKTSLQLVSVQEQSDIIRSMEILENYKKKAKKLLLQRNYQRYL